MTETTRRRAARVLREERDSLAVTANEAFLSRNPEWVERFGEKARIRGEEDAGYHLDFLAAAVEMDSPVSFRDYLRWTANMLESRGMSTASLSEHLDDVLDAAEERLTGEEAAAARAVADDARRMAESEGPIRWDEPAGALATTSRLFSQAAIRGDRRAAMSLVDQALRSGSDIREIYLDVLQVSQYEVGRRWETNEISVAKEHMATAVTQAVMTMLYGKLEIPAEKRGKVVVTGVEGEFHQLGGQMVADVLELEGWDVRFLGTQMPHDGILAVVEEEVPDLVGITATIASNLPAVAALVSEIDRRLGDRRPGILVGGGAFRSDGMMWREVGADGMGSNLRSAVTAASEIAARRGSGTV